MVPLVGLEPTTSSLPMMRNYQLCYSGFFGKFRFFLEMSRIFPCMLPEGARDPEGFNGALAPRRETATDEGISLSFAPAPIRFDVCFTCELRSPADIFRIRGSPTATHRKSRTQMK